jgi:hypothetical protein|tara:strand:+ start:95 stop:619 length:525 start_codon:yes stop_codon:yes gene_type:complete
MEKINVNEIDFGKNVKIGIFGDSKLRNIKDAKKRNNYILNLKKLIHDIDPAEVYIIPEQGVSSEVLSALRALNVPYNLVLPYTGYCDVIDPYSKLHLKLALPESKSLMIVGKPPKDIKERNDILQETENFVIDRSDVLVSIFGNSSKNLIARRNNKFLDKDDKHVIFVNYDTIG